MTDEVPALSHPMPRVCEIRLRRPGKANRLTREDLTTLLSHFDAIEADHSIQVVMISAEGRTFSAGFDLGSLVEPGAREASRSETGEGAFERVANRLGRLRPVTMAVLQGPVVGGSTDLALACDLRIGSERTSLMMPATRIGLPLYASALARYVSRLGVDRAKRFVLLGETIDADSLLQAGFLTHLVRAQNLALHSAELARRLADVPAAPLLAMKAVLTSAAGTPFDVGAARSRLEAAFDPSVIAERISALARK